MLDVSIRTGVLNLLARLKLEQGLGIILITHDLASARYLADRILVLYRGRIVEDGPSRSVIHTPAHPYTRALLAAAAHAGLDQPGSTAAPPASAVVRPSGTGCPFAARCPDVLELCRTAEPAVRRLDAQRSVRCHLHSDEPRRAAPHPTEASWPPARSTTAS
jgi:peptide/nickel transport system ATP-binding protein